METKNKFIYPGHEYTRTRKGEKNPKNGERNNHRMTQNKYRSQLPVDSSASK